MPDIFVDTDILLDLLAKREPHYAYAASLFSMVDTGPIKAFISPLSFSNLHYILRKLSTKAEAIRHLKQLRILVSVLPVTDKIIDRALSSDFNDFEDAIQYYTALENGLQVLLTRNKKDFKTARMTICTAQEYLGMLGK